MPPKNKANALFLATSPMSAADRTNLEAWSIIDDQNARRAELTASLREQRLARDAASGKAKPKKK